MCSTESDIISGTSEGFPVLARELGGMRTAAILGISDSARERGRFISGLHSGIIASDLLLEIMDGKLKTDIHI